MMHDNPDERLPIVNEHGHVIGQAPRGACHDGSMLLHPVVHLHIFHPDGRLYLQHRPTWKTIQPNRWDTAVGGHIDWADSGDVLQALRREACEELSLIDFTPQLLTTYVHNTPVEREFVYLFRTTTALPLHPSNELDGGQFFTLDEIRSHLHAEFFTPNFEMEWLRFLNDSVKP